MAMPVAKCHACGGLLATNPHPSEELFSVLPELLAFVAVVAGLVGGLAAGIVVAAVLAIGVAVLFYRLHLRTKEWKRYVPFRKAEP